jgi:hypothetical protein
MEKLSYLECPDAKYYLLNGYFHRTDGPAVEYADGEKGWYLFGKGYSFSEWEKAVKILFLL